MLFYAVFTVPALILSCVALLAVIRLSDILKTLVNHLGTINCELGEIRDAIKELGPYRSR